MKILSAVAVVVMCLTLTSCQAMKRAQNNRINNYKSTCSQYGFQPGTDAYARCVQGQDQKRSNDLNASIQNFIDIKQKQTDDRNRAVRSMGTPQIPARSQPFYIPPPTHTNVKPVVTPPAYQAPIYTPKPTVNCTSYVFGDIIDTTCQ